MLLLRNKITINLNLAWLSKNKKNFKKIFGFSCFKASEDMISCLFFMIRKPIDLLRDKALHSVKKRLHLQTDMSLCDFSFPRV